jgi:hypothetical protein
MKSAAARVSNPRSVAEFAERIGSVVILHSLKSAQGKTLNGKRAVVLNQVVVDNVSRWKVKVQGEEYTKTTAVKLENTKVCPIGYGQKPSKHPAYMDLALWQMSQIGKPMVQVERKYRNARGVAYDDDPPPQRARKLVELLDRPYENKNYTPNRTILTGEAAKCYHTVQESHMSSNCTTYHLEHISACLALAHMCQGEKCHAKGCGDGAAEAVLFAFLEAAPTALDVLMEFLVMTPYIGPEDPFQGNLKESF